MSRRFSSGAAVPVLFGVLVGCAASPTEATVKTGDAITQPVESPVKNQGQFANCWVYAAIGWAESLTLASDRMAAAPDYSEDYWTYWAWFDRIVNPTVEPDLEQGGFFEEAMSLMKERGIVAQGAFKPRVSAPAAIAVMKTELQTGRLSTPTGRRDHVLVRQVLDEAWGTPPGVRRELDKIFGETGDETLTSDVAAARTSGSIVARAEWIALTLPDGHGGKVESTLAKEGYGSRTWSAKGDRSPSFMSRDLQIRAQRALADGYTLPFVWLVDQRSSGSEYDTTFGSLSGAHASLLVDYEVDLVPGFGILLLGIPETRPAALKAALDPSAHITKLRLKNSWGFYNRASLVPGYTDLTESYFASPEHRVVQTVHLPHGY